VRTEPAIRPASALAGVLEAEAELFAELAEMSVEQRHALLAADSARLGELAALAETLALRFTLLDRERQRLEADAAGSGPAVERARAGALSAFQRMLRETAVSGMVLERWGDTFAARQAAVSSIVASTYLPDGRAPGAPASGVRLSTEG